MKIYIVIKKTKYWIALAVIVSAFFSVFSMISSGLFREQVNRTLNIIVGDSSPRKYYHPIGEISIEPDGGDDLGVLNGQKVAWALPNPDGVFNYLYDNEPGERVVIRSLLMPLSDHENTLSWRVPVPVAVPLAIHILCVFAVQMAYRVVPAQPCQIRTKHDFINRALYSAIYAFPFLVAFQIGRVVWSSSAWAVDYWGTLFIIGLGSLTYYLYCVLFMVAYFCCIIATSNVQVRANHGPADRKCVRCRFVKADESELCPECGLTSGAWVDSRIHIKPWLLVLMGIAAFFSPVLVASVYSVLRLA